MFLLPVKSFGHYFRRLFSGTKGAFPPSHLYNKLADKLSHKVTSVSLRQTNSVCYKFLTEEHDTNVRYLFVSRFRHELVNKFVAKM
jgi:hypothetical protein